MDKIKLFSTTEAAKVLGISRQLVLYWVKKKKIKPVEFFVSKYLFFSEKEIEKALLWKKKPNATIESITDNAGTGIAASK